MSIVNFEYFVVPNQMEELALQIDNFAEKPLTYFEMIDIESIYHYDYIIGKYPELAEIKGDNWFATFFKPDLNFTNLYLLLKNYHLIEFD